MSTQIQIVGAVTEDVVITGNQVRGVAGLNSVTVLGDGITADVDYGTRVAVIIN